jgi:uncharacterized protein (DUF58 family)
MVLAGAIGADIDQSVAFQAFALLVCLLTVALLWIPFFRGHFVVSRALPRLASVHQPFRYRVHVRNNSNRAYCDLELLEGVVEPRPTLEQFSRLMRPAQRMRAFRLVQTGASRLDFRQANVKPVPLGNLGPRAVADVRMELVPLRRGPLRLTEVAVARRDPFGLLRSFVRVRSPQSVLVLPKRYPVPPLAFSGTQHYQPGGVALASSVGDAEEFVSLRDYRPGDAFRRIHWRSWARVGRPIVKEYQDEFFFRYGLVLDTLIAPADTGAFEEAVSVAASFACTIDSQESLLDLLFVGAKAFPFTAGRSLGQSSQILEILASVQPSAETGFDTLRNLVLRHAPLLSGCICVFTAWDKARRDLVQRLRRSGVPTLALWVTDRSQAQAQISYVDQVHLLRAGKIAEDLQSLAEARV